MHLRVPPRGNRKLRRLLEKVEADKQIKAWWHVANVNAVVRLEINDHSWVHVQIVANIALKLLRQLDEARRPAVDGQRLPADGERVRGRRRARGAPPRRRDVGAPARPRGLEPLPRRAEDARAARRTSTTSRSGR